VEGVEAHIFDEYIDIDDMKAHNYLENDTIDVSSDRARMDKVSMNVELNDNVHIENKEGSTLDTESLSWMRDENRIETKEIVTTTRDNMPADARGPGRCPHRHALSRRASNRRSRKSCKGAFSTCGTNS